MSENNPTYKEAKEEYDYWFEVYKDIIKESPEYYDFCFKIHDPDVLAFLILNEDEQKAIMN